MQLVEADHVDARAAQELDDAAEEARRDFEHMVGLEAVRPQRAHVVQRQNDADAAKERLQRHVRTGKEQRFQSAADDRLLKPGQRNFPCATRGYAESADTIGRMVDNSLPRQRFFPLPPRGERPRQRRGVRAPFLSRSNDIPKHHASRAPLHPAPRSGERGPSCAAGWWKGHGRAAGSSVARPLHRANARSPSPASFHYAGADKRTRSRDALRARGLRKCRVG